MSTQRVIIVGGGLGGLAATLKIAEKGIGVDIFSLVAVKRSHSVCAQGGINGALDTKGQGDTTDEHFFDTVYGGDFLAHQPAVKNMCEAAPEIIYTLDRMGVMFSRTSEGLLDLRLFGGVKKKRTAFAGATTGAQIMYCMDEQVRRYEAEGLVRKFEGWDFLSLVLDGEGKASGITAMHVNGGAEVQVFRGDAVIIATGGFGNLYGKSTTSTFCTGAAASRVYQQGAFFANPEFIQIHPTAIPGDDKNRLMSEAARGEGGRIWTYRDGKPWYFLEEMFPAYGNTVPRDIASRVIFKVVREMGLGIDGKDQVYLDLTEKPADWLERRLGGILEIYRKFVGDDPTKVPMKIFPSIHYSMGGLWCDSLKQSSNLPGLFTAGECDYNYHGANRLGANSLLSALYSGMIAGPEAFAFLKGRKQAAADVPASAFDGEQKRQQELNDAAQKQTGPENVYRLQRETGAVMTDNIAIVREQKTMEETEQKLMEFEERANRISSTDPSRFANQTLYAVRAFKDMLVLARAVVRCAILRKESRGAHYRSDFPERDDENFLAISVCRYTPEGPDVSYEPTDVSLIQPRKRAY